MPRGAAVFWTPAAFVGASLAAMLAGVLLRSNALLDRALQAAAAILMIGLPLLRLVTGGPGWPEAIAAAQPVIAALDLALLVAGGWMLWRLFGHRLRRPVPAPVLQPAE